MKTAVIANPRAAKGRTGKRLAHVEWRLAERLGGLEIRFTDREGHAIELTRELLHQGADRIIGVGGDGTFHEIANGFIANDRPVRPGACLGLIPMGTGGDLRRTLRLPSNLDGMIDALLAAEPLEIDVGRITYTTHAGATASRYFINMTSFGMGGDVAVKSKNFLSPLGGKTAFFYATLRSFLSYRSKPVEIVLDDDGNSRRYTVLNVAIGNGQYHGGGMHVCPDASMTDGRLNVTVIEHLGMLTMMRDQAYLYDGRIYDYAKVRHFDAKRIRATSEENVLIEVDGEALGRLPVEVSIVPKAMHILGPKELAGKRSAVSAQPGPDGWLPAS